MLSIDQDKNPFKKTLKMLQDNQNGSIFSDLDRYGQLGVDALERATPVDTHLTASSWFYKVTKRKTWSTVEWFNDNEVDGVQIVILLEYGHGTRDGTFVPGRHFINPAMKPVFDTISNDFWKKVKGQ